MPTLAPPAADKLADLPRLLRDAEGYAPLAAALRAGQSGTVDGAWGSSAPLAVAAIAGEAKGPGLVVIAHPGDLEAWTADLTALTGRRPPLFPAFDTLPNEPKPHDPVAGARLRVLQHLASDDPPPLILTTVQSLLQPVPTADALAGRGRSVRIGDTLDVGEFGEWLVDHGYKRVDAVERPGEFARRGGIFDIFSPDADAPVRVELFGDEVESLRAFAAETQRSLGEQKSANVLAITGDRGSASGGRESGHLADHLPRGGWVALVEPDELTHRGREYRVRAGEATGLFSVEGSNQQLLKHPSVIVTTLPSSSIEATWSLRVESVERFGGNVAKLRDELDGIAAGERVLIACGTDAEIKRLGEVLAHGKLSDDGRLRLVKGHVHAGYRLVEAGVVVLGSHELFHRVAEPADVRGTPASVKRKIEARAIDSFLDLADGDIVVHVAHGIARFRGMAMLDKAADAAKGAVVKEENLILEFRDGVMMYVPASKIDLVQKYVGGSKTDPELSKIGGVSWGRRKERVEEAVRDLAADMIQMQAMREAQSGNPMPPDTDWQAEFEGSFPYQETPDQLTSLREIKADMQRPRPMDRLICGDVGYGKTELAVRAAFKAVDNSKQVAVLVPTTVLAEQHLRTFTDRFAEYPFVIDGVSRFKSAGEQRKILKRVAEGGIDVIIGTHRLVSADVRFKDLGLVIIDEEQRFGVEHKERLKQLRAMVDVLTLTATPIPRTLHFALLGIRDISNLETPPPDRLPIETRIVRFDKTLIRQAVMRELNREGQIYFIHNRVLDIHEVASRLRDIVPEAKIAVAHGQQTPDELETAMTAFVRHEVDVLVATTIVESGLDIPNANTIFIHEADRYGLADLHQLRGRVGRHKNRAYAYLLLEGNRPVTPDAQRRLKAIEEFTELGAGFKIALRDLEIRGAGNLLGTQQSGHIAAIGYELYCQLLENAVRAMKQMPAKTPLDVNVEVPWPAYLPHDYVPGQKQRLEVYRRLSRVRDAAKLDDFRQELRDRYGPVPESAEWMLRLTEVRIRAARWQVSAIHRDGRDLVLTYKSPRLIKKLAERTGKAMRVVDAASAYYRLEAPDEEGMALYATLTELLRA